MATHILVVADDVPWRLTCATEIAVGGYLPKHAAADAGLWDVLLATEFVAFVVGPGATSACDTPLLPLLAGFAPEVPRLVVLRPDEKMPDNATVLLRTNDPPGSVLAALEEILGPGADPADRPAPKPVVPAPGTSRLLGGAGFRLDPPSRTA